MLTLDRRIQSLLVVLTAYSLLIGLMITAPQNALGFWPGLLAGVIGCVLWRDLRTPPTLQQTRHRLRVAGSLLVLGLTLVLAPQRDIPIAAAPLGVLMAITGALILDRRGLSRSSSMPK
ncbi:hypothetical protein [Dyella sp. 2HG41-7]|uniref:hypothetical protein n=1 Tax=Dyella sp. 2HG41-7 TaxID=2883239 RepID=UPI001F46A448|nr:hypothetical protein [Dyella sp. 2HG41-7]